jgi:hypothetical protein
MFVYLVLLKSTLILQPQEQADKLICRKQVGDGGLDGARPVQGTEIAAKSFLQTNNWSRVS